MDKIESILRKKAQGGEVFAVIRTSDGTVVRREIKTREEAENLLRRNWNQFDYEITSYKNLESILRKKAEAKSIKIVCPYCGYEWIARRDVGHLWEVGHIIGCPNCKREIRKEERGETE